MSEMGSPTESPGLRARKKERTRSDLTAAALRMFAAKGFDRVTVDDISAAAGVSPRTFFRYFSSKEDVVLQDHERLLERLETELASRPAGEAPLLAVRRAVLALTQDYETEKADAFTRTRVMAEAPTLRARSLELQQRWEAAISAAVATRMKLDTATDLRPALVGAAAVAALRVATDRWLASGGEADLPSLTDTALRLVASAADRDVWTNGIATS